MKTSDSRRNENKRHRSNHFRFSALPRKKYKYPVVNSAFLHIKPLNFPLISTTTGSACEFILLEAYRPYIIGRNRCRSDFIFEDRRVSKQHCQFYFDASNRKVCLSDGVFFGRLSQCAEVRVSLNGVYLNGFRLGKGEVVELHAGDEVSLVCRNEVVCSSGICIGFVVERIDFVEEVVQRPMSERRENELFFANGVRSKFSSTTAKASFLLSQCRWVLSSDDPISSIRECVVSFGETGATYACRKSDNNNSGLISMNVVKLVDNDEVNHSGLACREELLCTAFRAMGRNLKSKRVQTGQLSLVKDSYAETMVVSWQDSDPKCCSANDNTENDIANKKFKALPLDGMLEENVSQCQKVATNDFILADSGVIEVNHGVLVCREELSHSEFKATNRNLEPRCALTGQLSSFKDSHSETVVISEKNSHSKCCSVNETIENDIAKNKFKVLPLDCILQENVSQCDKVVKDSNNSGLCVPPPGKKFYLNRLQSVDHGSMKHCTVISLPELLSPIENLVRVFVATFTGDILWFLSYCKVPADLPVTIACHNAERCWSSSPDSRTSVPFSDFPNLLIVYPPFPEDIAFGKVSKKLGIACHHPKLLVLQREDSIRVVITSANLVARQWHGVTNTVWWQDFPRASAPDYLSLFALSSHGDGEISRNSKHDFSAQLAGFMASLLADVPNQAHWILELAKYDFSGAVGHLVASVPGIYSRITPYIFESKHFLTANWRVQSSGVKLLASVVASVVGVSHLFRTSADSNGVRLKKLAAFLGKCHENAYGMSEIVLKRNTNIPADANAVSILIPNPEELSESEEDCIQLGFLPRDVAKWLAPLADAGLFAFSGYIYPKEVLATALERSNNKAQLILYVSQGPSFSGISQVSEPEHVSALCLLVASIQRCSGLWRLQEVLGNYKWPEHLETDFIFGSSSIGSVNAPFLAAFSAAAGKRSLQFSESESDPDWACWSASQELRNPSIRVIYPTIERVKNASSGILASKHILCFSEKTWQRLKNIGILHDAIPYPSDRVGYPLHVKVAQRRFQSKTDASSFGWVYCGSHNFSAAAWGRPISNSFGMQGNGVLRNSTVLGSRLHVCNYELGIIFIVPPSQGHISNNGPNLDDIVLPFIVPAPKYGPSDRPATAFAMREALAELTEQEKYAEELIEEEFPEEEPETTDHIAEEREDEKTYAEMLWSQS